MRKLFALLIVLCSMLLATGLAPARAGSASQASQLAVTATAGYGDTGAYIIGEWVPVRVTLVNPPGGQSMRVTVVVRSGSAQNSATYEREVDMPSQSRKEITLYTYDGSYTRSFAVRVNEGDKQVASVDAIADPFEPPTNMIVGVVSANSGLLNLLKDEQVGHIPAALPSSYGYYGSTSPPSSTASATVAHMQLADIPTLSQGLDSLGALILEDVDTGSLSEEQRGALESWVARGGTLVTAYKAGGGDVLAGLQNLSPVTVSGSRTVSSLAALGEYAGEDLSATGSYTVGDAKIKADLTNSLDVHLSPEGVPLLVVRDLGQGQVVYLGSPLSQAPLSSADSNIALMKEILSKHVLHASYGAYTRANSSYNYSGLLGGSSVFETYGSLFALPGLQLPNVWLVAFFLFFYIFIIGPVNFIVLRRMKRVELAWFTIPALVVIFSVVAYSWALGSKGGDLIAIRANVIQTAEGTDYATVTQHFGLYSPQRRTYEFDVNSDSLLTEINAYGYYNSSSGTQAPVVGSTGSTSVRKVNVDTWAIRAFMAQHTAKLTSPLQAELELGSGTIVGKVTNRTNGPLEDVALVRGGEIQYIGYMAPGESRDVNLRVSSSVFDNSSPVELLPPPAGVTVPQYGYYSGNGTDVAQRIYSRRVELLSAALYPLVTGDAPSDMKVTLLAWGPSPSTRFDVPGYATRDEEQNIWTSVVSVKTGAQN